jgi:glycosyltransferase involved in cell wall biosynthesis
MKRIKRIWISWESHRRTTELAGLLPNVGLFVLQMNGPRFIRYPDLILKTLGVLFQYRPKLVFVQNPSIVLSLFVLLIRSVLRFHVVVDAHNEGLRPFYRHHNWLMPIYLWIQKRAALTIVTNDALAREVSLNGGNPFVLEDPIPQMKPNAETTLNGTYNVAFVCTFEKDEPYMEVIKAAALINPATSLYITGRHHKISRDIIHQAPCNVVFTGFLPDQDYINLLHSCDAVIDLTLMQNCLVCGAYEAVSLGKPVILSDTKVLRDYFSKGAVYTHNSAKEIAAAIMYALENKKTLAGEISLLKAELEFDWNTNFSILRNEIDKLGKSWR